MPETSRHLADHIEARRKQLGLNPTQLAEAAGLSLQGLKNIRKGKIRNYQERLTLPLTRALGWTPDSIDRLLAGQEPVELVDFVRPNGGVESRVERLERELERLTGLVAGLVDEVDALGAEVEHGVRVRRSRAAPEEAARAAGS